jgi:integrase
MADGLHRIPDFRCHVVRHQAPEGGPGVPPRHEKRWGRVCLHSSLAARSLLARAKRCGQRPFIVARSFRLETVTNIWRRRIARAFEAAGPFEEPATSHRFRHTFARVLLQRGVPVADVADLLGDDEKTVRAHYARWVHGDPDSSSIAGCRASGFLQVSLSKVSRHSHGCLSSLSAETPPMNAND